MKKFIRSEAKYIFIFTLTGAIVAVLAEKFGLIKSPYIYHFIRHILYSLIK
ncbi:hypothetical protein HK297_00505 [Streptococcus agalactiae]|nr:hypothetical protein [Streptococcus agalactiae]